MTRDKLYIVMPVYNEGDAIEKVVAEWHSVVDSAGSGSRLVVFDDGSTDNTSAILESMKNNHSNLTVITKTNTGHGPTCTAAYKFAVAENADWVFQTDSDGQTKSDDFRSFWERRGEFDFIIGWRKRRKDGPARWCISRTLKLAVWIIFGTALKDVNAPFRLMKVERLRRYLPLIPDDYFLPNALLSIMIAKNNEKIAWREISFVPRPSGRSSVPLRRVAGMGIRLLSQLYKMRNMELPP